MLEFEAGIRKWAYLSTKLSKENGRRVLRLFEEPEAVRARRRCGGCFLLLNILHMGWELGLRRQLEM